MKEELKKYQFAHKLILKMATSLIQLGLWSELPLLWKFQCEKMNFELIILDHPIKKKTFNKVSRINE